MHPQEVKFILEQIMFITWYLSLFWGSLYFFFKKSLLFYNSSCKNSFQEKNKDPTTPLYNYSRYLFLILIFIYLKPLE